MGWFINTIGKTDNRTRIKPLSSFPTLVPTLSQQQVGRFQVYFIFFGNVVPNVCVCMLCMTCIIVARFHLIRQNPIIDPEPRRPPLFDHNQCVHLIKRVTWWLGWGVQWAGMRAEEWACWYNTDQELVGLEKMARFNETVWHTKFTSDLFVFEHINPIGNFYW